MSRVEIAGLEQRDIETDCKLQGRHSVRVAPRRPDNVAGEIERERERARGGKSYRELLLNIYGREIRIAKAEADRAL